MRKHNTNEFQGSSDNKHDINLNLWDLDGSSFFLDSNIPDLESTATFNNTVLNCNNYNKINNINIISSKNKSNDIALPFYKFPKNKNKSVNSSFVKYNDFPSERNNLITKNNKIKSNINNKKNKMKNNSFCHNYKLNDSIPKDNNKKKTKKSIPYNSKIKKAKQRLNHSVDYSRKEEPESESRIIFGNNLNINIHNSNTNNNKKQNLNKSLSIESINNKKANNSKILNSKNIYNYHKNYHLNNNKKIKKSNSIDHNINFEKKNKKNLEINNIKLKNDIKHIKIKENNQKTNKNKSVMAKRNIEEAEKYTNYLAKRKIFTHDYELQNKLKKAQEEREAEKEMSQCTFKPQLYNNKYNNRIQSQKINHEKKSLYEKQSQWLNNVRKKKENEREKKKSREIQGCTFIPQLSSLPKYNSKKNKTNREQMGEENYYNKMKKARQVIQEKNKGDDLVERYDERKRKKDVLPRSMLTFGNFNQVNNNEGSLRKNLGNLNSNLNNWKMNSYSLSNAFDDESIINSNNNLTREDILNLDLNKNNENEMNMNFNMNRKINNNYIYNNNINNNYIGLNNNNIFNNNINNNFIIENNNLNNMNSLNNISNNAKNNNFIIQNQKSLKVNNINNFNDIKIKNLNYANFINNTNNVINSNNNRFVEAKKKGKNNIDSFDNNNILNFGNFFNDSGNKKYNNINKKNNINSNNKYVKQRINNIYDFDNNYTDEKLINKTPQTNIFNPTLYNDEQEKENANISTSNVTKTNSILSLQKKSSHSLPDRPDKFGNNRFINAFNLNYRINQKQEYGQMNKINNANNNTQDDEKKKKKKLLMNELHNWNNFDEESNEDE